MSSGYHTNALRTDDGRSSSSLAAPSTMPRGPTFAALDSANPDSFPINVSALARHVSGGDIAVRYDIDKTMLAEGGNGKVFRGRDRQSRDRHVIIKKLGISGVESHKITQFRREAAIMKQLDHPNICKLFELYEDSRFMFFVMEECEGGELFEKLSERDMSERTVAEYISQIAAALQHAHSKQIAHRDLKPENVCLSSKDPKDRHIKVIDWGLGFFFGIAQMKSVVGSLAYAAPEVLEAEDAVTYSSSCDLWSLGIVTYVLMCGRPPFWGAITKQLEKMKKEDYPMRTDKKAPWPSVSDDCKDFIAGLLRSDPARRMPIAQVMQHSWLRKNQAPIKAGSEAVNDAMFNMKMASLNSKFLNVCVASAARQLDYRSVKELHEVFRKFDTNQDGALDIDELRICFTEHYGKDSVEVRDIDKTFKSLDLDGSGKIDYTEFIVAVAGEKMLQQEDMLWSSFKSFDVDGDDDRITKEEIKKVLAGDGVRNAWGPEVCEKVAQELFEQFDKDKLGYITFETWVRMMREGAWPDHKWDDEVPLRRSTVSRHTLALKSGLVAWVSLDPRGGAIQPYPSAVAKLIETAWQKKEHQVLLGEMFFDARVCFTGNPSGMPFQRTRNGLRDVRRVEVDSRGEVSLRLSGNEGEYRIDDRGTKEVKAQGMNANAVNPAEIKAAIDAKKQEAPFAFAIGQTMESTISSLRRSLFGQEESKTQTI
jgi:calcium-dependent protein kinase